MAVCEVARNHTLLLKSGPRLAQTYASDDIATYESMDAALQLLRQHRLAPKLQADISTALEVGRLPHCGRLSERQPGGHAATFGC